MGVERARFFWLEHARLHRTLVYFESFFEFLDLLFRYYFPQAVVFPSARIHLLYSPLVLH